MQKVAEVLVISSLLPVQSVPPLEVIARYWVPLAVSN